MKDHKIGQLGLDDRCKGRLLSGGDHKEIQEIGEAEGRRDYAEYLGRRIKFIEKQLERYKDGEIKDHEIAQLVNKLLVLSRTHHDKECLRQLISEAVVKAVSKP